jgi:endoglucanase
MSANPARLETLLALTQLPTASGHEWRVHHWIKQWAAKRPELSLGEDQVGNIIISMRGVKSDQPPLFITAHTDHPAFVIEKLTDERTVELSFRGGVMDVFFDHAPITIHTRDDVRFGAIVQRKLAHQTPAGEHYLAELDRPADATGMLSVGDVATWTLPPAEIDAHGVCHTHACDDLAALAAALCAMDDILALRRAGEQTLDVRLLFTRSEEIGFVGAIAACKLGSIPKGSRIIALENSRAFADSPVGGGPIVRVGDRLSIFTPWLTGACAQRAEETFGGGATPKASQRASEGAKRPWQRKLMAGGACEASVFCAAGYDATCICLPLGNYHNMPHLTELQAGTYDSTTLGPPRCAREFIHTNDYHGMIDLLAALGTKLAGPTSASERFDKMYAERKYVLDQASV